MCPTFTMSRKRMLVLICSIVALISCLSIGFSRSTATVCDSHERDLSFTGISNYLSERAPGQLTQTCIMKSIVRDGYYVIVDYSGRDTWVLYYEDPIGFVDTGISGLASTFSFKEVNLSQGDFLEVYSAGSMGTGYLHLYENNDRMRLAYALDAFYVIDVNMDMRLLADIPITLQNEFKEMNENVRVSWVYVGGRLNVDYSDYNSDGYSDIKLSGIRKTLVTIDEQDDDPKTIIEEACFFTYLFNPNANGFDFYSE